MTAALPPSAHVLIVDDSTSNHGVLVILLESAGYDVIRVRDGQHAMHTLRDHAIDLVVIDHQESDIDPLDMVTQLRGLLPSLPIIVCARAVTAEQAERYRNLGIEDVLTKPVDPHGLSDKIIRLRPSALAAEGGESHPFSALNLPAPETALSPLAAGISRYAKKLQTELPRLRDFRSVAIIEGPLGSGRFELALGLAPAANVSKIVCHADDLTPPHLDELLRAAKANFHPVLLVVMEADRLDATRQAFLDDLLRGNLPDYASVFKRLRLVLCAQTSLNDLDFNELLLMPAVTATLLIPDFRDRWMDWADISHAILRRLGQGRRTLDEEGIRWINRHKWTGGYMQLHRTLEIARRHAGLNLVLTVAHLESAAAAEHTCNDPLVHDLLYHLHSWSG